MARIAAAQGNGSEALRELQQASALEPDSADLLAEGADLLAQIGRRTEAERAARQALEKDPSQPRAMRTLADLLAARGLGSSGDAGARSEAAALFGRLADMPDADAQVLQILTNLKLLENDFKGALDVAQRYAARRPGDPGAARLVTQLLLQQGRAEEALASILAFLATNGSVAPELLSTAGEIAERAGKWPEVEQAARGAVARGQGSAEARLLWGESLLRIGKPEEALQILTALEGTEDAPRIEARSRGLLGEALLRVGRSAEAIGPLERALEGGATDPIVRLHLASAYGAVGRLADATALARALAGDYPGNPAILVVLGESCAQQGLVGSAAEAFGAATDALRGSDEQSVTRRDDLRLRLANLYVTRRKYDEASRIVGALERPERNEALQLRARLALVAGRTKEARRLAAKLGAAEGPGVRALVEGEALLREGRIGKAEAKFADAVGALGPRVADRVAAISREAKQPHLGDRFVRDWARTEPASAEARFALGRHLERTERFEEAVGELRRAIELQPEDAEVLNYLGYSFADRGENLEEALDLVRRAIEIDPWNGAFLDSLGWAYFRMGEVDKAREPLEKAAREYPRDPTVLEHLGDLYDRLGDRESAERVWRRALEEGPEDPSTLRSKISGARLSPPADGRNRTGVAAPAPGRG